MKVLAAPTFANYSYSLVIIAPTNLYFNYPKRNVIDFVRPCNTEHKTILKHFAIAPKICRYMYFAIAHLLWLQN